MFLSILYNGKKVLVCKRHNVRFWFCPIFLFVLMGVIVITTMILVYLFGNDYFGPEVVVALVTLVCIFLLITGYLVIYSFEKLISINKLQSEFISVASHELRSPLASMKWSIEMILKKIHGGGDNAEVNYLKIVEENIQKTIKLVNNLLDISRLENNDFYLKREEVVLKEIVLKIVHSLTPLIEARRLNIEYNFQKNCYNVLGDPDRLELVIQNLVDNAIKYSMDNGKITINVDCLKDGVRFSITDEGFGIPSDQQKFIFHKFFRADNAMRFKTEGIGLGLFIAKSIIDKSGGKIGFYSKNGGGTTFWFTAPIFKNYKT